MITYKDKQIWVWLKDNYPDGGTFGLYADGHFRALHTFGYRESEGYVAILKIKPCKTSQH